MSAIRGVLLDVDGTLVDSNDAHANSWVRALAEAGHVVHFESIRKLIGMGGDKLLPTAADIDPESKLGKAISKRRGEIFLSEYLPKVQSFPGANELLVRMREHGLKLAVASSAKADELKPLLEICGAEDLVEATTSSDDADRSKPDPDIVHAALTEIDLPAEEVLMLGDTPYDVEAATRAGVRIIAFRCGGWSDSDLKRAIAIYDGPSNLLEVYESSPLVRGLGQRSRAAS